MTTEYNDGGGTENQTIVDNGDIIDIHNSTTTPLLANTSFTGGWSNALNYSHIMVQIISDQAGTGITPLQVQFSTDGTNIDHTHEYGVDPIVGENVQVHVHGRYYRIIYNNGAVNQTYFRLQTILKPMSGNGTIIEVDDRITSYDDAVLTKSVISGKTENVVRNTYEDVKVSHDGSLQVVYDPDALDAFGRLRTSNPHTLFESQFRFGDVPTNWDTATANGGTATHLPNESSMALAVTTTSGSSVIRETKHVMHYQPGKSLLVLATFVFAPGQVNLTQRVGYYGAQNGAFFSMIGTTPNFMMRSYISGSVVDTPIPQSQWNLDTLDGSGDPLKNPSGLSLDVTKAQILFMDFEWLGVGRVHYGFIIDGRFIICHHKEHANNIATVYMSTACLPCRYEIFTTGTTAQAATMRQICTTVLSEGGYEPITTPYFAGTGLTPKTITTAGVYYPIISIRLNSTHLDDIVFPTGFTGLFTGTAKVGHYKVILNASLTGASWATHAAGHVDYDISATSFTGGTELSSDYIGSTGTGSNSIGTGGLNINDFAIQLGRSIAGVADTITVVATADTNGTPFYGQISWRDLL